MAAAKKPQDRLQKKSTNSNVKVEGNTVTIGGELEIEIQNHLDDFGVIRENIDLYDGAAAGKLSASIGLLEVAFSKEGVDAIIDYLRKEHGKASVAEVGSILTESFPDMGKI